MKYAEYAPTQFDGEGLFLDDRQDWDVLPIGVNRDTQDALTLSNWDTVQKMLEDAGIEHEIHRFGHWACGWFEIIIIAPGNEAFLSDLENRLEDYPAIDDVALSAKEAEQEKESWDSWGRSDLQRAVKAMVEAMQAATEETELHDPHQKWCKDWGMMIDVCGCGSCYLTEEEYWNRLLERIEGASDAAWAAFRKEFVTCEMHGDGPHFKHDFRVEDVEDFDWSITGPL
jgi:hypothetical protein